MVDVMAPVLDNPEEVGSWTRSRRARSGKPSPSDSSIAAQARRESARRRRRERNARARRDEHSDSESGGESDSDDEKPRKNKNKPVTKTVTVLPSSTPSVQTISPPTPVPATPTPLPATPTSAPPRTPLSTLAPLPIVSDPGIVANPQQSIPDVTTIPLITPVLDDDLPAFTLSSNPRKGEGNGLLSSLSSTILATPTGTPSITAQLAPAPAFDTSPAPTIFIADSDDNGLDRDHDDHHNNGPSSGLSPTAEDVLISAGSIGAFILICFVVWVAWRTLKKSKRTSVMSSQDEYYSSPNNLLAKIPYFGRNQRGWQGMDGPGPQYDVKSLHSSIYSINDPRHASQAQPMSSRGMPVTLPELQTNFTYSVNGHPYSATTMPTMIQPTSAQSMHSLASLQNALRASQQGQQLQYLPQAQTNYSPTLVTNNPFASPQDGPNASTLNSQMAAQYGIGTMETFESLSSDRSRMPDAYYNQSELARQASTAYDPKQRAVYRASALSSISSGFGDGDFIIPPPPAALQQPEDGGSRPISYAKSTTRGPSNGNGQRDTVYTTTSEDMPARYRSVNSWVNQQTGRVQRQQARDDDADVPPVPALPAEDRFTMMMDDGEVPRKYEDTLSSQPPMPSQNPFDDPVAKK